MAGAGRRRTRRLAAPRAGGRTLHRRLHHLGASLGYNFDLGESRWLAFVKGTNLTNQTVRYASSILATGCRRRDAASRRGVKVAF